MRDSLVQWATLTCKENINGILKNHATASSAVQESKQNDGAFSACNDNYAVPFSLAIIEHWIVRILLPFFTLKLLINNTFLDPLAIFELMLKDEIIIQYLRNALSCQCVQPILL